METAGPSTTHPSSKKRIFVIEDDFEILTAIEELLQDEGYEVHSAKNGQEALDQLRDMKSLPHLILLDLMMPVKDGMGFRSEQVLDPRLKDLPVILMSADGQIESKKTKMGIIQHLKKPLDIETLLQTVEKFMLRSS